MIRTERRRDGGHLRLVIDQPKGNIISRAVIADLRHALARAGDLPHTRLVTIEGAGDHFSYGASVEEHQPDRIGDVLPELHDLIRAMLDVPAATAAIVRGRCLGGGFELALACDFIFAASDAMLGVPEIALGVFPPAAAALLPIRIGVSRAARAVVTGQIEPADRWASRGLIDIVSPPQELDAAIDAWYAEHLATRSAASLNCAVQASRLLTRRHIAEALPALETLYLATLMRTHDAAEGIAAFLDRRKPAWTDA